MRHRLFGTSLFLAALAMVACGSRFEAGTHSQPSGGDDESDGGSEAAAVDTDAGTIIIGPPHLHDSGSEAIDATADGHEDADAEATDANDDSTLNNIPDASSDAADSSVEKPDTGPTCLSTEKLCGDQCVLKTSAGTGCAATSCTPCSLANTATAMCDVNGACAVGTCTAGYLHCSGPASGGCETSISTPTNCGSCGHPCDVANPYCVASGNTFACTDGCPGTAPTLCNNACVNETTSIADCGGCSSVTKSYACTAPANGSPTCSGSTCGFTCDNGFDKCNNDECVSFTTDPKNCGTCNNVCPTPNNGSPTCAPVAGKGTCGISCTSPYSVCGSACVDEQNDLNNCGGCTTQAKSYACTAPANATPTCAPPAGSPGAPGVCAFSCNLGYQLCNGACVQADPTAAFVSNSSSATGSCGTIDAPCGTIAAGIAYATATGTNHVYIDQGSTGYTYAEQLTIPNGMTLEGGWLAGGGGHWTKVCTANDALAVVAPTNTSEAAIANGVTATLVNLSIHNAATASTGESLYGIFATNGTTLTLVNVNVTANAGGNGSAGSSATPGSGTAGTCGTATVGSAGTAGSNGSYGSSGYLAPASGGPGGAGAAGTCGAKGGAGTPQTCDTYPQKGCDTVCSCGSAVPQVYPAGDGGAGGPGGNGGGGGGGGSPGGSSIALFAWNATITVTGGSLAASNGGAGGPGTAGASGAPGGAGAAGTGQICETGTKGTYPGCATGGTTLSTFGGTGIGGVTGASGGAGGGGAGGDSYGYYAGGGATVTANITATSGTAGTGGSGGHVGAAGHSGAHN